jgi:CRP/FNR family transcriptional regulator
MVTTSVPYGLEACESCFACKAKVKDGFCDLDCSALQRLEAIKSTSVYPKGSFVFVEGQTPRGIFILCRGRVKLSLGSVNGKILIRRVANPGEVIGLSAVVCKKPYEWTAEAIDHCCIGFIKREEYLRFLQQHNEVALRIAKELSEKYHDSCEEIRRLAPSRSAGDRLAKLLLDLSNAGSDTGKRYPSVQLLLTQEEMAQMIGISRETVTRIISELKKQNIVETRGSTLVIRNKAALQSFTTARPAFGIWSTVMPAENAVRLRSR